MPFIKNDNKHNRRVFIKNIFTGSFGLALGVVVGCSDNSASNISKDTNIIALELSISNKIGLNVDIQNNKRNKGKISFECKHLNQLNKIIDIIKSNY